MKRGQYASAKSYESVIPLILILVLAVFIAGKFGLLDLNSIPVLGSLFPAPYMKVVVVGRASPTMESLLASQDFRELGITYALSLKQQDIHAGVLKDFDIIILQGDQYCDRIARKEIAEKVKAGGKLIVIENACIRVHDDTNALGWDIGIGTLEEVIPVKYGGMWFHERTNTPAVSIPSGKFKIIAVDHPMFNGIVNMGFSSATFTNVVPNRNAKVLAYVDSYAGSPTSPSTYAIVESQGLLSGKVLYFAFDPSRADASRNLVLNMLLYMKGAKG